MTRIRNLISLLTVVIVAAILAGVAHGQDSALIRFVHIDADAMPLDVNVNGQLAAADLRFGGASTHVSVPAGAAEIATYFAATSVPVHTEISTLASGPAALVLVPGMQQIFNVAEDLVPVAFGQARISLFNALNHEAQVAVSAASDGIVPSFSIAPYESAGPVELDAGAYEIALGADDGNMVLQSVLQPLSAGAANLLIIHGTPDDPQIFNAEAAVGATNDSGRLRFVHAISGAAPFGLQLNDQLLVPALGFAEPTPHIALPSGTHEMAVSIGPVAIIGEQIQIRAGDLGTVVLMRDNANLRMFHFADATSEVDQDSAVVSLINAIPDSVISHLQMESGAIIALNVPFTQAGDAAKIVPGRQSMTLHLDINGDRGQVTVPPHYFFGGAYYNLIALDGGVFSAPRLLIAETSLQRQLHATMPNDASVQTAPPEPDTEESPADQPVSEPVAQADTPDTKTPAETNDASEDPVQETVSEESTQPDAEAATNAPGERALTPYAIVNVNPNAALHLRQYPTSQAMSLGLLPAESDLMILGRRGPAEVDGDAPIALPVDLSGFVDQAPALLPYQDLPAADTWLYAMYRTPDNGALYGWVNALYLEVFDLSGGQQRLANLPLIRQNQPGSAYNTDTQPPELADRVAARVFGLNARALLNLRRGNDTNSEVLAQLPIDATMRLIGLDEAEAWAFVEYQSGTGNALRGWVSMDFTQLLLNDAPVKAAALRALDPSTVPLISGTVFGGVQPAGSVEPAPPMDGIVGEVNVNFDSALHLRRYPDATSESLAMIPPDTLLHLGGVTDNGGWYKVTWQGEDGWVASPYVVLSMDGRKYARAFLEGQLPRFNDFGY